MRPCGGDGSQGRGGAYQCGKTILHLSFFSSAIWHLGWSMDRAQRCVTSLVIFSESIPPMAMVAPIIDSLSVGGMSAQERTTSLKNILGSGEKGRSWACLLRVSDADIQVDLTTGIIMALASVYSGKSIVLETICVTLVRGRVLSRFTSTTWPPKVVTCWLSFWITISSSNAKTRRCRGDARKYLSNEPILQIVALDKCEDAGAEEVPGGAILVRHRGSGAIELL